MTEKTYINTTLYCKRKGGSNVSVIWSGKATASVVDRDILKDFLESQSKLTFEHFDSEAFFAANSRAKEMAVTGSFAVDELFLMLLNLEYSIYPDEIARHELYLPDSGDSLAITVLCDSQTVVNLSSSPHELIDFSPVSDDLVADVCPATGCVNTWHAPKRPHQDCDSGCLQPCHIISVA
jgi:hypothetical protein